MEFSNKGLAFLLVVAIVISLGGTIVSLNRLNQLGVTGKVTDIGTTSLTLQSNVAINFTTATVAFGTGSVNGTNDGVQYCNLTTNGSNGIDTYCTGTLNNTAPFILRNDGNVAVSLALQSNATAAQFIGGTSPAFEWKVNPSEAGSCGASVPFNNTWYTVNSSTAQTFCTVFYPGNASSDADTLRIDIHVGIPEDAPKTTKGAKITATGTE